MLKLKNLQTFSKKRAFFSTE